MFFNSPFSVSLASSQLGATIRYTTDYSEPTATHSQVYQHPIRINQITVLRAAVFADASLPFNVVTKTYIFGDSTAINSLPVLSLVIDHSNLWGNSGIMERDPPNTTKRGLDWERPVSAELLVPGQKKGGFQID